MTSHSDAPADFGDDLWPRNAWLCRWNDQQLVVWAPTIEEARLAARVHAGPATAVSARLATRTERGETVE